jgi:hypothetical protein
MAESPIQSSFIPRDATEAAPVKDRVSQKGGGLSDLLMLVAIVIFVASLALAAAVFLYDQYLSSSASSKLEQLTRARDAFEPSTVHEITRLDDRMRVAAQVLGSHMAPTAFFQALSQTTLATVSFTSLELSASDSQQITVKMSGIAESVNSIALQADLMSKNGVITSPIFSDINRQQDGVHFNLSALVNPAAINYVQLIAGLVQQAQGQQSAQQGQSQFIQQQQQQTAPQGQDGQSAGESPFGPVPEGGTAAQ